MSAELNVLLVEDEPSECEAIRDYVKHTDDIRLVGATNSSDQAVEYVQKNPSFWIWSCIKAVETASNS